jgi:ubiquinone/menaquinone biosynthesis C-methylase UbiE
MEGQFWDSYWKKTPQLSKPMIYDRVMRVIGNKKKVLDVGGGAGTLSKDLTVIGSDPTVLEISQEAAKLCDNWGIRTVIGELPQLPFGYKAFDYATAINVLEFIPDIGTMAKELARVAPRAMIAVPRGVMASEYQKHVFTSQSLLAVLKSVYQEVYVEEYVEKEVIDSAGTYRTIPSIIAYCYGDDRPKKTIMVAVPNLGTIRNELADWLLAVKGFGHLVSILPLKESYGKPIDFNRTQIARKFLESGLDYLLMVDSDLIPPSNIMMMVDNDLDICSADIRTWQDGANLRLAMTMYRECEGYDEYKAAEVPEYRISEIDACGTGCMLVHRKVLEKVSEFRGRAEDYNFCKDARQAGFKVHFDTRFRCYHYVTIAV